MSRFRELRLRVRRLTDSMGGAEGSPAGPAVPQDEHDEGFSRRARAFAAALRSTPPVPPDALNADDALAAIHERAARGSARAIGPSLLRRLFAPISAPADVAWVEPADPAELAALLGESPPRPGPRRPPVWSQPAAARPRLPWVAAGMAAAALVVASAFGVFRGTQPIPELVFQRSDAPLSSDHSAVFLRELADR